MPTEKHNHLTIGIDTLLPSGLTQITESGCELACAGTEPEAVPCGLCLQVMAEFCSPDFPVYLGTPKSPGPAVPLTATATWAWLAASAPRTISRTVGSETAPCLPSVSALTFSISRLET